MIKSKIFTAGSFTPTNLCLLYMEIIHRYDHCVSLIGMRCARMQRNFYFDRRATNLVSLLRGCARGSDKRQAGIIYCASSINPPPSPISRTHPVGNRSPGGRQVRSHERIPGGWKVMLRCVPAAVGITCRINTILARGISERRRHELRITACTRPRYARAQKQSPNVEFVRARDRTLYNTVPLKLNTPIKRIQWNSNSKRRNF